MMEKIRDGFICGLIIGSFYGGLFSVGFAILTGNSSCSAAMAVTVSVTVSVAMAIAIVVAVGQDNVATLPGVVPYAVVLSVAIAVMWSLYKIIQTIEFIDRKNIPLERKIPLEELIDEHKQREWVVNLISVLARELAEAYPIEWNDWQHWISDMLESQTRMQSKGMHHRLVSLITFYRLFRFVWHIGVDKVFVLTFHRATR